MEEQKNNKEIKMEAVKSDNKENQELSYDQLKDLAQRVFEDNRYLKHCLQEANNSLRMFNRLDYLFKVVEIANSNDTWKFDEDFITMCLSEIQTAMTPPIDEEDNKETIPQGN